MKFKTFILTFLMMMSCSILFGHQTGANYDWDNVASLQDNAKMDTQFQIGDNSRGSSEVVAKIGENTYATLQEAFEAAAQATEATTITLLSNITIESDLNNAGSGYFNVADGKNVTLDLGGKKITATDNSTGNFILFYNYGEFTIKNGTVELTATNNRLWNAESAIVLNRGGIFNCESGTYTHKGGSDMSFVFDNSGNYYGDATMNIGVQQRSTDAPVLTSSYIAIRNRMEQNSHGASGTTYLNVYGGTISGTSRAVWAQAASVSETAPATGEINVEGGNIGLIDTPRSTGAVSMTTISGGTVAAFKGEVGELQVVAPGEITGEITILTPGGEPANYIIDENGNYIEPTIINVDSQDALQSAINDSQSGDVITVNEDIELTSSITIPAGKYVILDLNGKTINTAWEDESAEKHYYAFENKGTLTITNNSEEANGVINARGNFNYGILTLEKGTINAIDHNGGYGVRNYEGSKFTMNGGLIATTNENGDIPGDGYDATTVRVDSGAEFIMNEGEINNISNYTFAIDNYGTTEIKEKAGEVKSVHTTLANYGTMTISAGTFICNGLEDITAHALWAADGTTTINGGTFDGKDNYNGFNVCASAGAVVEINGGNFEPVHSGSLYGEGTITVKGGTFFDNVSARCAEGYAALPSLQNTFVVGETPTATVNNLGRTTVAAGDYMVYGGGTNTEEMPLSFVMQFLADQDAEDMATSPFAEWYGDFVLTFSGIKNGSFTADGCYLAGHYGSFGWVKVPVDGMTINEGQRYPVMLGVGLGQEYDYICSSVEDFKCALYLTPEILEANPNIQVNLALAIVDNSQDEDVAANALVENENVYEVVDYDYDAIDFNMNYVARIGDTGYEKLQDAFDAAESGNTIKLLANNNENILVGNENLKPYNKTIIVEGNGREATGSWNFGRDDNQPDQSEITVTKVNFKGYGISIDEFKSVTISECTFTDITSGNAITVICDNHTETVSLVENTITNVAAGTGIRIRNAKAANVESNIVDGTFNNAILLEGNTYGDVEVVNNVIKDWGKDTAEKGRAIRIVKGANTTATIENNAMIHANAPEEFVKITGNTENVSIDKNYWNGANPVEEHTPAYYLVEGITPNSYYGVYTEENGLENLLPTQASVAQIGDYYYPTVEDAFDAVQNGETILMIADAELETTITIPADQTVILDLNGKNINYNSTNQGEAMITNSGNLTINDSGNTGEIYYNYTGAADPTYGKGNYTISNGGTLTVNGGKIHIAKLSQHAKYPIDNNSTSGDAILVINGGHLYNYNTSAIRQFCNSDTHENSVTINGGKIEGYCAIWVQNPGSKTVNGQLTINGGEIKSTAKAYVNGTAELKDVASRIYCTIHGEGGAWDEGSALIIEGGIINENVGLDNATPASVTLNKEATYNGSIKLYDGGQFVHNGLMNVTLSKDITGTSTDGWYTISSPVGTVNHTGVEGLLTDNTHDLYRYNEETMMWENVKQHTTDFTTLEAGRGYIYANTANTTLSFTGDLVVEAVEQNITATTDNELKGFNLVGNPFTHNITLDHISGANLAEGFYTLTNEGAWYANNSTTGVINALQGALVKTTSASKITINPAVASKRTASVNNGQLEINVSNANYNDVAYVSFNEGIGLDKIEHRNANIPMVYVPVNGTNYAVAIMSNDVTEIPVSFRAMTMGQYTIGVEAQDCEYAMMTLVDRFTGVETNLLIEDYTFMATSNDNAERFIIKLAMSNSNDGDNENFAFINNGMMYIYNIEGQGMVSIYDVTGRPVAEYNVATSVNISTSDFAAGVYIIRMSDENGVKVQKIVIE